jgi:rhodanese-related sulfurtransferase
MIAFASAIPCANGWKNDFLPGGIVDTGCRIRVKNQSIQFAAGTRRPAAGGILLEAAVVAATGMALAFAANQISPRGLALARNYFPTGTNNSVRMTANVGASAVSVGTNSASFYFAQQLAAQMKQEGLQLIASRQAAQFFHDAHLNRGIVFIDARDESYYRESHIPGAYEFDPYHPESYFPAVLPVCQAAEQIVVYCNGGDCDDSQTAALLLRDVGIPNRKIFVYSGGITEWTNNRLPVEIGDRNSGNQQK